jgi:hypothetical protein
VVGRVHDAEGRQDHVEALVVEGQCLRYGEWVADILIEQLLEPDQPPKRRRRPA